MQQLDTKLISWASILDPLTRDQALTSAQMPFIQPHIALMADAHLGMGATVGSVIPTQGAVMPAAVGVDIGCGMSATKLDLNESEIGHLSLRSLRQAIERVIPVSAGKYCTKLDDTSRPHVQQLDQEASELNVRPEEFATNWKLQLGTLGGGNHFIEICRDENRDLWIFLHSGSRGVGNRIARKYIQLAGRINKQQGVDLPHRDLAYLREGTPEFDEYIRHLTWAQSFARHNRQLMMTRVHDTVNRWYGRILKATEVITCHHNYTEQERHYGKELWVTRKGAINASEGRMGLIPGSMGTRSYVVRGKGNKESLNSAPHGAGRVYSRTAAKKLFSQDDLRKRMHGIEFRDSAAFIDEIPDAYKDIDQVMEDSRDLVEVVHELSQIVNVKGT